MRRHTLLALRQSPKEIERTYWGLSFPRAGRSASPRRLPGSLRPNVVSSGSRVSIEDHDGESAARFDVQRRGRVPVLPSRARRQSERPPARCGDAWLRARCGRPRKLRKRGDGSGPSGSPTSLELDPKILLAFVCCGGSTDGMSVLTYAGAEFDNINGRSCLRIRSDSGLSKCAEAASTAGGSCRRI